MPYCASANCKKIKLKSGLKPVHYSSTCIEAYNQRFVSPNLISLQQSSILQRQHEEELFVELFKSSLFI